MAEATGNTGRVQDVVGDATAPHGPGPRIIAHVCNDAGGWGRGFVVALARRWPQTRERYVAWSRGEADGEPPFALGQVQFVEVGPELWVANMVGQHGVQAEGGVPPVRYEAMREALARVADFARSRGATVHMPRVGCGLAGGTWDKVGPIVEQTLCDAGVDVTVYDLPLAG